MARGAGGLRGSGTRGRRDHGPAPAPIGARRTPRALSAAAARAPAAIFPASRPARPRRALARPRSALEAGAPEQRAPIGPAARARFLGRGLACHRPLGGLGTAPRAVTATAAPAGQRQARPGLRGSVPRPAYKSPRWGASPRALPRGRAQAMRVGFPARGRLEPPLVQVG